MSRSLTDWVDYIQTLHARTMDLSLERVAEVYQRLYPDGVHYPVITIAGTNGKGSTAELLASIYRQAGLRVGKYTSPHLVSFTERYNIQGQPVAETLLINAFERIEEVRGEVSLTFFEFGTLLAIDLFAHADLDVAVMEVGLGGRLDAVNILDPELTIITSIALDHTAWLGDSLEQILVEKFGVTRKEIPCVIGMQSPPENLPLNKGGHFWKNSESSIYIIDPHCKVDYGHLFQLLSTDSKDHGWVEDDLRLRPSDDENQLSMFYVIFAHY